MPDILGDKCHSQIREPRLHGSAWPLLVSPTPILAASVKFYSSGVYAAHVLGQRQHSPSPLFRHPKLLIQVWKNQLGQQPDTWRLAGGCNVALPKGAFRGAFRLCSHPALIWGELDPDF